MQMATNGDTLKRIKTDSFLDLMATNGIYWQPLVLGNAMTAPRGVGVVCSYLRNALGDCVRVVVNANKMKRECCLNDDCYADFAKFAQRQGRDLLFDMTIQQTATPPWEFVIAQAQPKD